MNAAMTQKNILKDDKDEEYGLYFEYPALWRGYFIN